MDSKWKVEFTRSSRREFKLLESGAKREAAALVEELREDPFPIGSEKLRGYHDYYRAKFYRGRYRMIFRVFEGRRRILITRVRPRSIAYSGLADTRSEEVN